LDRATKHALSTRWTYQLISPNLGGAAGDVQEAQETIKNPLREIGHGSQIKSDSCQKLKKKAVLEDEETGANPEGPRDSRKIQEAFGVYI
jgi:hypothetical protein